MKASRTRRSKKASPDDARTPPGAAHAVRHRRGVTAGKPARARAGRERAPVAREETTARRELPPEVQEPTARASHPQAQTRASIARLMDQMREANERLIVAAVEAQKRSDEAHLDAAQARADLDDLMSRLRGANEQLATMAEESGERERKYRRLSSRLLTLQDEERRRLALDLHDPIGQRLAALAMHLDVIEQRAKALDAGSRRALAESRSLTDQCAREVRTFAYLLHPPLLDEMGLRSAVRWYAKGFTKRSGIHVVVELADVGRLPRPIETALFRVVQESLTNVHRHAPTSTASIRLTATPDIVSLEIHDHGHGRRDRTPPQTGMLEPEPEMLGVGIQGMRERIRQLGGTFDVQFTDKGTTVCVAVPLKADTP